MGAKSISGREAELRAGLLAWLRTKWRSSALAEMVTFELARRGSLWTLSRDGQHLADYSHLERATRDAVNHARALARSGEPAQVRVEVAEGRFIEVDTGPREQDTPPDEIADDVDRSRT